MRQSDEITSVIRRIVRIDLFHATQHVRLTQLALGMENKELSVEETRSLIDRARSAGTTVFFIQKDFDRSQAVAITDGLGSDIKLISINPLAYEWADEIQVVADAIAGK